MLNKIWEWIKNLDLKTIIISIIEFLIFLFILTSINNCNQERIEKLDQNLTAARDSIEQVMLINGNILSERDAYIVKTKQLEEVLKISIILSLLSLIESVLEKSLTVDSILTLLYDHQLCNTVSKNAKTLVKQEYNWNKIAQDTHFIYQKAICQTMAEKQANQIEQEKAKKAKKVKNSETEITNLLLFNSKHAYA